MIATVTVEGAEEATLSSALEMSSDSPVFSRILMSALFIEQWNIVSSFANRDRGMTKNSCCPIASLMSISGRLLETIISWANTFLSSCNSTSLETLRNRTARRLAFAWGLGRARELWRCRPVRKQTLCNTMQRQRKTLKWLQLVSA